ncbi:MAG TPA: hypothetical protein VG889_19430 [Rhizomicrobium sp.]|nr:hypothetical protein [Rhizomicrobium sp.]
MRRRREGPARAPPQVSAPSLAKRSWVNLCSTVVVQGEPSVDGESLKIWPSRRPATVTAVPWRLPAESRAKGEAGSIPSLRWAWLQKE